MEKVVWEAVILKLETWAGHAGMVVFKKSNFAPVLVGVPNDPVTAVVGGR